MYKGYLGKILWVDLSEGCTREEPLDEKIYLQFMGGYGIAAKLIFDRQPAGLDAFDPNNIIAIMSGLLTNGKALFNGRWMLAGKSPLTGTWGDSNCGGTFAPSIKGAGYDGIFIQGAAKHPVYLLIDGDKGEVSIEDASVLWGSLDAVETERHLNCKHGPHFRTISIGAGGENLALISGVVNDRGRVAGRSGFGAAFGAKKLKAVCVRGTRHVSSHDDDRVWSHSQDLLKGLVDDLNVFGKTMKNCGTAGTLTDSAETGDSPIKNWLGVGPIDFPPEMANETNGFSVTEYEVNKYYCHGCPFGCGGICHFPGHKKSLETHRPEYETLCGFGAQLLNKDLNGIFEINEMCNRAGIDTISCATTVNWAFEAYERGLLKDRKCDCELDLELTWGNYKAAVELVRQITTNQGFGGRYLKDGLRRALQYLEIPESDSGAMHVHGQELPMHDSRLQKGGLGLGVGYETEPTPGRHTATFPGIDAYTKAEQGRRVNQRAEICKFQPKYEVDPNLPLEEVGEDQRDASCGEDVINALGLCNFGFYLGPNPPIVEWANATTGWELDIRDYLRIGQRIKTVRHAFNIREGIDVAGIRMPERARGVPALKLGPNAYSANALKWDDAKRAYYVAMEWDPETAKPTRELLDSLNLPEVKQALYGE